MLVDAEPERLYGRHPELARATHVLVETVADEDGLGGPDPERVQRPLEDGGVRLPLANLGREDGEVELLAEPHLLEVALEEPARVEGVRDEPELEPARP